MKDVLIVIGMVMEMILVLIRRAYYSLMYNFFWIIALAWCVVAIMWVFHLVEIRQPEPMILEGGAHGDTSLIRKR